MSGAMNWMHTAKLTDAQRKVVESFRPDRPAFRLRPDGTLELRHSDGKGRFEYVIDSSGKKTLVQSLPPPRCTKLGKMLMGLGGLVALCGLVTFYFDQVLGWALFAGFALITYAGNQMSGWHESFQPGSSEVLFFEPVVIDRWCHDGYEEELDLE